MTIPSAGQADIAGGVTRDDLAVWDQEFQDVCARLDGLFYRTDSRAHARHYVRGLIAPLERKNGWTIAEYAGEPELKALQRLLNLSPWDADEARDLVRVYAMEHFADPRGVLIADPTGFTKKGNKSAGAQRQYSGTLGPEDIPDEPEDTEAGKDLPTDVMRHLCQYLAGLDSKGAAALIVEQQNRVRDRFPDLPAGKRKLFAQPNKKPGGTTSDQR